VDEAKLLDEEELDESIQWLQGFRLRGSRGGHVLGGVRELAMVVAHDRNRQWRTDHPS
jgi:hypothetical protein